MCPQCNVNIHLRVTSLKYIYVHFSFGRDGIANAISSLAVICWCRAKHHQLFPITQTISANIFIAVVVAIFFFFVENRRKIKSFCVKKKIIIMKTSFLMVEVAYFLPLLKIVASLALFFSLEIAHTVFVDFFFVNAAIVGILSCV